MPKGSRAQVVETPNNKGGTVGTLKGLGAHAKEEIRRVRVHRPCGATPAASGKRTQNGPSTEHYPQNEIWLDYSSQKMQIA